MSTQQYNHLHVRLLGLHELTDRDISAWKYLELRAIEANAYLSPNFVIPAIRHLDQSPNVRMMFIEAGSAEASDLVGVFIFKQRKFNRYFPLPHISAFHSRHSFITGLLADAKHAAEVVETVFDQLYVLPETWYGLMFDEHPVQGKLQELERVAAVRHGLTWLPYLEWERSVIYPPQLNKNSIQSLSKNIRKNFNRSMEGLKKLGQVDWRIVQGEDLTPAHLEMLMELENSGWKGKRKSSLYSQESYTLFFREMIERFNKDGRAFLTELHVNNEVIGSSSNLISGEAGFAFKSGWSPAYAKYSPGVVNRLTLIQSGADIVKQLDYIDSGAAQVSYINYIWPQKRKMYSGVYIKSNISKAMLPFLKHGLYPGYRFTQDIKRKLLKH